MIVAFDYDDVLVDFVGAWCDAYNMEVAHDELIFREDLILNGWDMSKHASELVGEDWLEFLRKNVRYWEEAETTPGAVEAINELRRRGIGVEIVTNKPDWAQHVVWGWLARNQVAVDGVIITTHFAKHEVSNADVLVDDRPSTVRSWIDSRPERSGILFARSQNENDREGLLTAYNFDDVLWQLNVIDRVRGAKRG